MMPHETGIDYKRVIGGEIRARTLIWKCFPWRSLLRSNCCVCIGQAFFIEGQ